MIHQIKNKSILFIYSKNFLFFEWKLEKSDLRYDNIKRSPEFNFGNAEEKFFLEIRVRDDGYTTVNLNSPEDLGKGYYVLTVLKNNGYILKSDSGSFLRGNTGYYSFGYFMLESIKEYPIIITCTAKSTINDQFSVSNVDFEKRMREFSTDWIKILELSHKTDIELISDGESIKAHRVVLQARSPVFRKMFEQDSKEASKNTVDISDIGSATMKRLVNFLYTGIMDKCDFDEAMELYYAGDKYEVLSLREDCKIELLNHLDVSNACRLFTLASKHNDDDLKKKVVEFVSANYSAVINRDSMNELNKDDMLSLTRLCVAAGIDS